MSRRRPTWPELPEAVRVRIEDRLGAPVVGWTSHDSGYSPGPALTLATATDRVFVKAADVAAHPVAATLHRREAQVAAGLPAELPAPALRWVLDDDQWVVVAFDAIDGHTPRVPWVEEDVRAVARLIDFIAGVEALELRPLDADGSFNGWEKLSGGERSALDSYDPWAIRNLDRLALIEQTWTQAATGTTLVHGDLRGDNVLLCDGEALAIDWPYASRGAAFCDLVGWLPSLRMEGGPEPEEMLLSTAVGRAADPEAVTAYAVAIAGYFVHESLLPEPPGIPHLRGFQRAQGEVCLEWLALRLGR
jgi:aminoglycoside phosphotransferase (APT) family kinase protein